MQSAGSETIRPRAFLYLPKPSASTSFDAPPFTYSSRFHVKMTAPPAAV